MTLVLAAQAATQPTAPVIDATRPPSSTRIITTLTSPSTEPTVGIGSYNLYQSAVGNAGPWTLIANLAPGAFPYTWTGAIGPNYWIAARGVDNSVNLKESPLSNVVALTTTTSQKIKWHPGHYMSSEIYTRLGNIAGNGLSAVAGKANEIDIVRAGPAEVLGWEGYYFWRALDNAGAADIDGSGAGGGFDADYVRCTGWVSGSTTSAVYNAPRRFCIYIMNTDYFSPDPRTRCVPDFILTDPTYGPVGPDGVNYGYWTCTGGGGAGTGSVNTLYRQSVSTAYQNFMTKLAHHVLPDGWTVDTSPYVEWIKPYLETAACNPQRRLNPPGPPLDSTYSEGTLVTQLQALNAAGKNAFPNTNFAAMNNYFGVTVNAAYTFELTLPSTRTASSGPDTFGASSGQNNGNGLSGYTHGQCAYVGLKPNSTNFGAPWIAGGTDLRGIVPYLCTVQNTELIGEYGAYFTPDDIMTQADSNLRATHISWQYTAGEPKSGHAARDWTANWFGTAANQGSWNAATSGGVLATIKNRAISHVAYPTGYP